MLDVYTVSFFGHRQIDRFFDAEEKVNDIVENLILEKKYVAFILLLLYDYYIVLI